MISLIESLSSWMRGDTAITDLVATRIYPNLLPQSPVMPAMRLAYVSGESDLTTDGMTGLARATIQIDYWALTYAQLDGLFNVVRLRINGYRGDNFQRIELARTRDLYDYDIKAHRRTSDYDIWFEESTT